MVTLRGRCRLQRAASALEQDPRADVPPPDCLALAASDNLPTLQRTLRAAYQRLSAQAVDVQRRRAAVRGLGLAPQHHTVGQSGDCRAVADGIHVGRTGIHRYRQRVLLECMQQVDWQDRGVRGLGDVGRGDRVRHRHHPQPGIASIRGRRGLRAGGGRDTGLDGDSYASSE